ncbi:shikimate kinase [Planctomycetota bacterium]
MNSTYKDRSNLVLIGMPGAGKSTVGVILAKQTARDFVDTDVVIQTSLERRLQSVVDTEGCNTLRLIEEQTLLRLFLHNHVIATGGSAVYSDKAMKHLKSDGIIVFLDVDLPTLETRVNDFATRGLAKRPEQTFEDLFEERLALYTRYADVTIVCSGLTQEEVCTQVITAIV